jgi:hypothetical protein
MKGEWRKARLQLPQIPSAWNFKGTVQSDLLDLVESGTTRKPSLGHFATGF